MFYIIVLICMISCGSKSDKKADNPKEIKRDTINVVKETVRTETKTVFVDPEDTEDVDELRDALKEAYDKIRELKDKLETAQMLIDDARTKIHTAQMNIEDARILREPMLIDDAEMDLNAATSDLDDAESELW